MGIRSSQTVLDQLYAIRDAALAAMANPQAEIVKYTLDGRSVELRSFADIERLEAIIRHYEAAVVASTPVFADLSVETASSADVANADTY
jgi:hypothetical protein